MFFHDLAAGINQVRSGHPFNLELLGDLSAGVMIDVKVRLDLAEKLVHRLGFGKVKADFDIYHDPSGQIAEQFKIEGMPTSYLIDASGKVVKKHIGFYTKHVDKYEREIEELL